LPEGRRMHKEQAKASSLPIEQFCQRPHCII
jgi:hypothetical protein